MMGHIFYSVNGEGRGHATRARTIIEHLRARHRITVFSHALRFRLLEPVYRGTNVRVFEIDGPEFQYANNKLSYWETAKHVTPQLMALNQTVMKYVPYFEQLEPDLLITDFEPYMPRAANICGVPFISLDHQHFLMTADLSPLPMHLKAYAAFMTPFVRMYYTGANRLLVSQFYRPPTRAGLEDAQHVGVLLRPEVLNARVEQGEHLIAYLRRSHCTKPLEALRRAGAEVLIYGLGDRPSEGNLHFRPIDNFTFVEDMASSRGLVCTAGNQLIGEALYMRKPVFAMPEDGNFEQQMNAWFLRDMGCGVTSSMDDVTREKLWRFMARAQQLRDRIHPARYVGNFEVLDAINEYIETDGPSAVRVATPRQNAGACPSTERVFH